MKPSTAVYGCSTNKHHIEDGVDSDLVSTFDEEVKSQQYDAAYDRVLCYFPDIHPSTVFSIVRS